MAYASLKYLLQRSRSQGEMNQAIKAGGPQNSAQGDSCGLRGRSEDLSAGMTIHASFLDGVVSAAGRRLRERHARPWAEISEQELSAGVLAVLQGLTDVILPESIDKQSRETPFSRETRTQTVVEGTGEVVELGISKIHSCTIEPYHSIGEASIQRHNGDEQASEPQQRAPELQAIQTSCSDVQDRPEHRLDEARNATIREQLQPEEARSRTYESPLERETDLQFQRSASREELSPVKNRSHIADDALALSSNAAMSESDSINEPVSSARDPIISDRDDVTWLQEASALHRAGALHSPDRDDIARPSEPADLSQMLSPDERRPDRNTEPVGAI
ncbi:hypothetical protein BST61_g8785 [Cercospora zeina]